MTFINQFWSNLLRYIVHMCHHNSRLQLLKTNYSPNDVINTQKLM